MASRLQTPQACGIQCHVPEAVDITDCMALTPIQLAMVAGEMSTERWQRDVVQIQCDLDRPLDRGVLQDSLDRLVARHESLRARLHWDSASDGRLIVDPAGSLPLRVHDLRNLNDTAASTRCRELSDEMWLEPFDVRHPPRMRVDLLRWADDREQLILTYQETVLDEHAGKMLMKELLEFYDAAMQGTTADLPPAVPFRDYQQWFRKHADPQACQYWSETLAEARPPTTPPLIDTGAVDEHTQQCCGVLNGRLSEQATSKLAAWAESHGSDLGTALLAAWSVVNAFHSQDEDGVRFNVVLSQRQPQYPNADTAVAMCFTVLPFMVDGVLSLTGSDLLGATQQHLEQVRSHGLSLGMLLETRRRLGQPGNQSLIFYDDVDVHDLIHQSHPEWTGRRFELYGRNPYAIAMRGFGGQRMRVQAWYNPHRYNHEIVQCLLDQMMHVLEHLPAYSNRTLDSSIMMPDSHRQAIEAWSCGPERPYQAAALHRLFEAQAQRQPEATAVCDPDRTLTYRQLEQSANQVGRLVSQVASASRAVGIYMGRSTAMIQAVLGTLKSGRAYVPINVSWPTSRAARALGRLGVGVVITDEAHLAGAVQIAQHVSASCAVIVFDAEADTVAAHEGVVVHGASAIETQPATPVDLDVLADSPAYVIFTSGSTGEPKGVQVSHRAVCNLLDWATREYEFTEHDRALCVASLGFDLSVFDIFGLLGCGGSLRIASADELAHPDQLLALLCSGDITFWNSAPQTMDQIRRVIEAQGLPNTARTDRLRLVFLSGDWIPTALPGFLHDHFANARVVGLGGATEATVWSNAYPALHADCRWRSIPYGRPIQNAQYRVLDTHGQPRPVGAVGELYIAGDVLADGYANDPEQTSQRFVPDPFAKRPQRMYRTGDAVRWWPDGNMEILGRLDDQVKVRGYRVELAEVEHALRRVAGIGDAAAFVQRHATGENQLLAHVVCDSSQDAIAADSVKAELRQWLPDYMVPARLAQVPSLPLTSSGKIDRKALALQSDTTVLRDRAFTAPRTARQRTIAHIFSQLLGLPQVGIDDNFFEMGGDSLLALEVIFMAEQADLQISIDALRDGTVAELAQSSERARLDRAPARATPAALPLTPSQRWLIDRDFANPAAYAFTTWLQAHEPIDLPALQRAWQAVVDHHEVMRVRFVSQAGCMQQRIESPGRPVCLGEADMAQVAGGQLQARLLELARDITTRLKLDGSWLPSLTVVHLPDARDVLYVAIPHMITDEFSARMVLDDLGAAYLACKAKQPVALPPTSTSLAQWTTALVDLAADSATAPAMDAFCNQPWDQVRPLPRDHAQGSNQYRHARDIRLAMSGAHTEQLLLAAREASIPVQSLLLLALADVLAPWAEAPVALVDVTGNGRQPISGHSVHRTAGFFSVIYPLLITAPRGPLDPSEIRRAHQRISQAPGSGVAYGAWRHLTTNGTTRRLQDLPAAEIKLNYHGNTPLCPAGSPFAPAPLPSPPTLEADDQRYYLLNLEVSHQHDQLVTAWKYSRKIHHAHTIEQLAERFLERLHACASAAHRGSMSNH
jgi:amino acid adenylation domain-containing protein/non-ribosomal peptide synthase protein (TIGR01720 family)